MHERHRHLLAGAATALCLAAAAPAGAQSVGAPPTETAAESPPAATPGEPARLEPMKLNGRGIIRPFGGPFELRDGKYRTFAGDVVGTAGRIRAMEDRVGASAGRIRAMAGDIGAFAGRIRAMAADPFVATPTADGFWGTLYPKYGSVTASAGRIRAMDGDIAAFAGRIRAMAGRIRAMDGTLLAFDSNPADYRGIHAEIAGLVSSTKTGWGATVSAQSGGATFEQAFADRMLAKYGIDLADARSVAGLNEVDLELFLLDWRDNLQLYSGLNPVDHWMGAVNWSPAITSQLTAGVGGRIQIGVIDFTIEGEAKANVVKAGGVSNVAGSNAHGSAVASLIVGGHDGRGVMGFAPNAQIISYNPFDATQTASWTDVKNGLRTLGENAYVINLSLGVPGYTLHPEWRNVLADGEVRSKIQDGVFVLAAGNEGITQTQHVNMKDAFDSVFLVVGSVDPNGAISGFSNRPGTACLTDNGDCKNTARWAPNPENKSDYLKESGLLMNRFIVAPGEFMLVDDGKGGVTRMSGTSFAAPLVSGAIALIAERWPWMMEKPLDVANVVLSSARDLGDPGTDPVYGRGMLDVAAALAPRWGAVKFKQVSGSGVKDFTFEQLRATTAAQRATWEANDVYFSVFEKLTSTERDFQIPMSSKLVGQTTGKSRELMQAYLTERLQSALGAPRAIAGGNPFAVGFNRIGAPVAGFGELAATVTVAPKAFRPGLRQGGAPFDAGMALGSADGKVAVRFGGGPGGADLDGQRGFGLRSDHDVHDGGANPFLGLASGAGYAAADVALNDRLTLSAGVSAQNARRDLDRMSLDDRRALRGLEDYRASAGLLSLRYQASGWLRATATYTVLNEGTGLLGMQSLDSSDFAHGSTTDAATVGADVTPGHGLTVSLSGTVGRTREGDMDRQSLGVADGGLVSSAFQVAVAKAGLFDGRDRARLSLAQPLHVEGGSLQAKQVQVVDRRTGEQGVVIETFGIGGGGRRFVAEAMYGRSVLDGQGELGLFGRADLAGEAANRSAATMGGSFRLAF